MDIMKSDVKNPVGNVDAKPTNPGAKESPVNMTNLSMGNTTMNKPIPPSTGGSGKSGATGPGKKSGTI